MTTLAAYLHDIDPFAIQFTETWGLRWYGMSYLLGFVLAYFLIRRVAKTRRSSVAPEAVMDLIIILAIGTVIGGRLGYVLFYSPRLLAFTSEFPYWGVFRVWDGGMASHGAMIGLVLSAWLYVWRTGKQADPSKQLDRLRKANEKQHKRDKKRSAPRHRLLHILDLIGFGSPIGMFFGRIANFINGELVGRACSPDLPWAVKFPQDMRGWVHDWSVDKLVQLTDAVEKIGVSASDWQSAISKADAKSVEFVEKTVKDLIDAIQAGGATGHSVGDLIAPLLTPRHPSQLYAAVLEGLVVFTVMVLVWRKPRKPGVLTGWCMAVYGLMRISDEFFRQPDAHIRNQEFATVGITRGQLLSTIMVLAGIAVVWFSARRNTARMGGWRMKAD